LNLPLPLLTASLSLLTAEKQSSRRDSLNLVEDFAHWRRGTVVALPNQESGVNLSKAPFQIARLKRPNSP
jgi:hypothetical protein